MDREERVLESGKLRRLLYTRNYFVVTWNSGRGGNSSQTLNQIPTEYGVVSLFSAAPMNRRRGDEYHGLAG